MSISMLYSICATYLTLSARSFSARSWSRVFGFVIVIDLLFLILGIKKTVNFSHSATSQRSDFRYSAFLNLLAANSISCCMRTASPQGIDAQASQGSAAPLTERSDETCSVEQFSSADREYSSAGRTTLDREYRSAPFSS